MGTRLGGKYTDCKTAFNEITKYGFGCNDNLMKIIGKSVTLNEVCCVTCTDVSTRAPDSTKGTCSGKCGSPSFAKDGNCDDDNNNCGCNWDNGDCCGSNGKKYQYGYCSK